MITKFNEYYTFKADTEDMYFYLYKNDEQVAGSDYEYFYYKNRIKLVDFHSDIKGCGSILMKHIINWCEKNKMIYVFLDVKKENEKAINFYKKFGFEINDDSPYDYINMKLKLLTKFNEYFTWNDEVTEKIIDLGKLYDQQEESPLNVLKILKYELRPQPTNDEYKKMILFSTEKTDNFYILDNGSVEACNSNGVTFRINGKDAILHFENFHDFSIKIKILKRIYSPEDPYSEEEWEQ